VIALLPALVPLALDRDRFVFDNLGYPLLSAAFYGACEPRAALHLFGKLRYTLTSFFSDPGNAALLLFATFGLGCEFRRMRVWASEYANPQMLLVGLLAALAVGALGPTPTQYQYFFQLLPFLALTILYTIAGRRHEPLSFRNWKRAVMVAAVVTAATGLPRWYWPVIYLPSPQHWTPLAVHRVGEWVKHNAPAHGRVLTIDPLVPLEAGVDVYQEYAVGRFIMHVGGYATPEQRHRYHLAWGEELDRVLAERPPDAILCKESLAPLVPGITNYATGHGFRAVTSPDAEYRLWVRPVTITSD
jgi:hypothetical protein